MLVPYESTHPPIRPLHDTPTVDSSTRARARLLVCHIFVMSLIAVPMCSRAAVYSKIPQDTEVLLTHTPAHRIKDKTRKGARAGCSVLARRLRELESCRLHVFGHIHEARGAEIGEEGKVHVNAAIGSRMGGLPVVVDLLNNLEGDSA